MSEQSPPPEQMPTRRQRPEMVVKRPPADRLSPHFPAAEGAVSEQVETVTHATRGLRQRFSSSPDDPGAALTVPWWAFALVILVVAGLTCGAWGFVLANRGDASTMTGPTPTPIFVVITATPTLGPEMQPTPEPGPEEEIIVPTEDTAPPAAAATATAIPQIALGSTIVITGTDGEGLAIRQGPGTDYSYFFVGYDGDTFVIEDGPREANGYTWWYIVDPADANRAGWAVDAFMQPVAE